MEFIPLLRFHCLPLNINYMNDFEVIHMVDFKKITALDSMLCTTIFYIISRRWEKIVTIDLKVNRSNVEHNYSLLYAYPLIYA